ncbi:unnamed protein product [Cladocopium goreaui]|uniref:C2H2-type domain-containing protein n=1 Tax=Cladocopium goreaui TaxID=2562237 RepID=A0A9P1GH97_9DINO|nr:unnamed protein product [Cladocopium goreaui]
MDRCETGTGRSEGYTSAMGGVETSRWYVSSSSQVDVKLHGMQPPMCGSTKPELTSCRASPVVKRSLHRAQKRAHIQGFAWYRPLECLGTNLATVAGKEHSSHAKAVQCLWNAPFMPITQYGHAPLLCHLARYWIPPPSQPMHGLTPHQRQRGRMAKLSNSSDWQEFVTHSASAVWRCFDDVLRNQCLELQDVHDTAMKTFSDCFPAMSRPKPPEPWTQNVHTLNKWQHRQLLQAASDRSVKGLFDAWFHAAKFQKLTRCHRRHAKQLRKHRFEETLRQANFAAASHDTHQLFDLINRFAPRTHRRRVQLRSECGALMTPSEERSMLVAYVRETWRGPLLTPLTCDEAPGVPFTVQDLAAALRKIPSQKATAAPCAPGIAVLGLLIKIAALQADDAFRPWPIWAFMRSRSTHDPLLKEFEFLLHAIGILFSLLHEFDMTLNPTKSIAILAMHGPKSRKVRTAWVQRDHRGEMLKIPITGKPHVLIPIKEKATYLGCIMSYQHFEDDTTWHRVKFANVGFMRLRRWLCNRNHFSLQHRLSLWRACILPIMTYGVFAVGTTVKGLQHMLTQLGIMLRRIVGDHAHHTRHTNFQVFETFDLPRPTDLLTAAVETLQRSIAQRDLSLGPADIALKLDWSHLDTVIGTITQAQAAQSLQRAETAFSGAGADPPKCFFCNICSFCSNSVSAFRRHCTTAHGLSMFRIFAQPMHSYTTDGLPTCKYCAHSFTTWRSFRTHIERGCQALILGPASCTGIPLTLPMTALNPPRVDAALRGAQMLTEADLALLKSKPWSNRLFQIIADDTLDALEREHEACGYLSSYCCICGQHLNRTQDVHLHYRTEHAAYWDFVPQKSRMLTNIHSSESPCPHCGGYFKQHQCPVWTQVAVLILHGGGLHAVESGPPEAVVRCDICLQSFADAAQLAKCAHCWTEYSTMESLRSHISQGRCSSFDAFAATEVVPLTQAWLDICLHGRMYDQLRAPMDRLHLTLKCVQCKQAYQRAGDLANHLMTNHSNLWRQIAMMYYRLDQVPFMPIQLHDQVTQILRKVCLQCGTEHHAGVLCRHIQEAHLCGHRFVEFYFDTLVPAIAKTLQNDFQCDLCCQVYNLPPDHDSPASLDSRAVLVQIHLHGNCPGDSAMIGMDQSSQEQIRETFQFLQPLLDQSLKLLPNPRAPKQRRTEDKIKASQADQGPIGAEPQKLLQYLQALGQLVLRQEHSLSLLQSTDSFILYFQQDKEGSLQGLLLETQKWHQQRLQDPATIQTTLRQHLCQHLLLDLLNRVTKVSQSKPEDPLFRLCREKNLILEDMSWPFLRWEPSKKQLVIDKKKSVTMPKMLEHLTELGEEFRDPALVVRFQGLATSSPQSTVPWKLQLNLRYNRPYDLLVALTHSAVWMLAGTTLKIHAPQQSGLAKTVQSLLPKGQGKGKSQSKSKGKSKAPDSQT